MMRHIIRHLSVALLTLTIGVAAAYLWIPIWPHNDTSESAQSLETPTLSTREAFKPTDGGGDVYTSDGCVHEEVYRAWDGSQVIFSRLDVLTPTKAAKELRKLLRLGDAEQIVERTVVTDEKGKKAGERVVVLWRIETVRWRRASVMWTRGGEIFFIDGKSLELVLKFERQEAVR